MEEGRGTGPLGVLIDPGAEPPQVPDLIVTMPLYGPVSVSQLVP